MATGETEDLRPFLVYQRKDDSLRCAIWSLADGRKCLGLFLTEENAQAYIESAELGADWHIFQPNATDLLEIFRQSLAADIRLAVLDPDQQQGKRLFDLQQVVGGADEGA